MSFRSPAFQKALSFRNLLRNAELRTFAITIVFVAFAFTWILPSNAEPGEQSFDELYEKAQFYYWRGLWSQSINCYKKALLMRKKHFGYLASRVDDVVARDPFNPDGHIARGLVYQSYLEPGLSQSIFLTDYGQSEFEYRQAITLSPNRRNNEALKLLKALPSLKKVAEARNKEKSLHEKTRSDFLVDIQTKLLLNHWKPCTYRHFYLTRIKVDYNVQSGDLRAVVVVPSSNPEYDEAAFNALQTILDDFRFFALEHYEFQFASQNGHKWIECVHPGNLGRTGSLASMSEPRAEVLAEARRFSTRWTESRVKEYCTVETQLPRLLREKFPPVGGDKFVGGDFNFQLPDGLMPAYWRAGSYWNNPVKFAAIAGNGKWVLEYANIDRRKYTDDDFLMHRLNDAIFLSARKYELAHIDELGESWKSRRPARESRGSLVRDGAGKVIAFKSQLSDGSEVTVDLDSSGNVETIRVDGKADAAWNRAYQESALSLELVDRALQNIESR